MEVVAQLTSCAGAETGGALSPQSPGSVTAHAPPPPPVRGQVSGSGQAGGSGGEY